jgi:hypothetical protein
MGSAIDDEIGIRIARDRPLPSTIPDNSYDRDGDIDTTLRGLRRSFLDTGELTEMEKRFQT